MERESLIYVNRTQVLFAYFRRLERMRNTLQVDLTNAEIFRMGLLCRIGGLLENIYEFDRFRSVGNEIYIVFNSFQKALSGIFGENPLRLHSMKEFSGKDHPEYQMNIYYFC